MIKLIQFFILLFVLILNTPLMAGNESGGGSDELAEVYTVLDDLLNGVVAKGEWHSVGKVNIKSANLIGTRNNTIIIISAEPLYLEGEKKQAIYTKSKIINQPHKIELHYYSWKKLTSFKKKRLLLHEILSLADYDDFDFKLSTALVRRLIGTYILDHKNLLNFYMTDTIVAKDNINEVLGHLCPLRGGKSMRIAETHHIEFQIDTPEHAFTYELCNIGGEYSHNFMAAKFHRIMTSPKKATCVLEKKCDGIVCTEVFGERVVEYIATLVFDHDKKITNVIDDEIYLSKCE